MDWMAMHAGLVTLALLVAAPAQAQVEAGPAASAVVRAQRIGGDLFAAGSTVTVDDAVAGDLFAGAGTVDVNAPVDGDVVVSGGRVRLGADVGHNVYLAGGQVTIAAQVSRNARVAGGQIEFGPKSQVTGNLTVAAGDLRLRGSIGGQVRVAGGQVLVDGPIGGDIDIAGGRITLGPNARIAGKLRHRSGEPIARDPAAQVAGGIEELLPGFGAGRDAAGTSASGPAQPPQRSRGPVGWWTAGLALLAALVVAVAPGFSARAGRSLRERPGWSLGAGFVVLVCAPVAALLLLLTIIGIPVALAGLALYAGLLPVAWATTAVALGDGALARWAAARAARPAWRAAAAAVAVLLVGLAAALPWVGGIVVFAALVGGLGALALQATPLRAAAPA